MSFDLGAITTIGITVILTVFLTLILEYFFNKIKEKMKWKNQKQLKENIKILSDVLYPLQVLQVGRFDKGSIDIRVLGRKDPDQKVLEIIEKYKDKWEKRYGMYNNDIFSVSKISFFRKGKEEIPLLYIEGYTKKYFEFLATNANLNLLNDLNSEEKNWLKKQTENSNPQNPVPTFANPLSVEVILLCENGHKMVLPKRSEKTVFRGGKIGASVMETVSFLNEYDESTNSINVFDTIKRGLKEELGVDPEYINENDILITSLMFDWEVYDYKFTAIVTTNLSENEIRGRFNVARGKDVYENTEVKILTFPPKNIDIEDLKKNYDPEAIACVLFALVEKKGWKAVEKLLEGYNEISQT